MRCFGRSGPRPIVTFDGEFHGIDAIGLGHLPPNTPFWLGCGDSDQILERAARPADGGVPVRVPSQEAVSRLHAYARAAGRGPWDIGVGTLADAGGDVAAQIRELSGLGITHVSPGTPPGIGLAMAAR